MNEQIKTVIPKTVTRFLTYTNRALIPYLSPKVESEECYCVAPQAVIKCTIDDAVGYVVCVYMSRKNDVILRIVYPDGDVANFCIISPLPDSVFHTYIKTEDS